MRIAGIVRESTVDGLGINLVIYCQGCPHKCKGCHNPSTHDATGGKEMSVEELKETILSAKNDTLVNGVTFSGGEPLMQYNGVAILADYAKQLGLRTTLYTGFNFALVGGSVHFTFANGVKREIINDKFKDIASLSTLFDYIVDGNYIESRRDILHTPFRGSTNQRFLKLNCDCIEEVREF